jgi:UDP-N-acetylglucosamine/UDP-N-acetylgalactosamine diphosphorylase
MTSDLNHTIIQDYFKEHSYFDYPSNDIYFFEQGLLPCFDLNGKIIIDSATSIALAPDGNGGIYEALQNSGAIQDMLNRHVKYLHVYGIDNVLIKSVDPLFMGICIEQNSQCGNKVVTRANKSEKVGMTVNINNRMHILEYSEIPVTIADLETDIPGQLLYRTANICNHFISIDFLQNIILPNLSATYHIAMKKIPFYDLISKQISLFVSN